MKRNTVSSSLKYDEVSINAAFFVSKAIHFTITLIILTLLFDNDNNNAFVKAQENVCRLLNLVSSGINFLYLKSEYPYRCHDE